MSRTTRMSLIQQLEKERGSKVISYIDATRAGINHQLSQFDVRIIYDHLLRIGKTKRIDLLLNSFGGDITFAWRLVHLIREFTQDFNVIIPLHAFSAATLISFGANSIVMLKSACLGPTDPSSNNPYNPKEGNLNIPINVEDISSYVEFISQDLDLKSELSRVEALKILSQSDARIHPLALGASKRGRKLAKKYAIELLGLHMKGKDVKRQIEQIAEKFSSELLLHEHPINREEALEYNLKIVKETEETEGVIWELFKDYENELELNTSFNPVTEFKKIQPAVPLSLGNQLNPITKKVNNIKNAIIESDGLSHTNIQDMEITGLRFVDSNGNIQENYSWIVKRQEWIKE